MAGDPTEHTADPVSSIIRESRLVFGGVLVDGTPRIVERLDREEFDAGEAEMTLGTALVSANSDLVPLVTSEDGPGSASGDTARRREDGSDRLTSVDSVLDAVGDAHTYYLLCNTGPGAWKRIRNVAGGEVGADDASEGSAADRYLVADALVDEATERIGDLPDSVTGTEIEVIEWDG